MDDRAAEELQATLKAREDSRLEAKREQEREDALAAEQNRKKTYQQVSIPPGCVRIACPSHVKATPTIRIICRGFLGGEYEICIFAHVLALFAHFAMLCFDA